jgi:hypothetical protein
MREAMRAAITIIPAHQWVCDDCLVAFFTIISTHSHIGERPRQGEPLMKKLSLLGIIIGAALLTAAPISIQPSPKSVAEISVDKADALVYRRHYRRAYRRSYYGYGYGGAYYGAGYPRLFGYGSPAPYYGYPTPYYAYAPYPYGSYPPLGGAFWSGRP